MKKYRWPETLLMLGGLVFAALLVFAAQSLADDHRTGRGFLERLEHEGSHGDRKGLGTWFEGEREDKGNETTGEIAAWLWGAANLTIALSILIKGVNRFAPLSPDSKSTLTRFNQFQKKHLMPFHYFLNPLILGIAVAHWLLSRCRSTSLPEWGLLLMTVLVLLGAGLKLRLVPKTSIRAVYRFHTQPVAFLSLIAILLIGHSLVD